MMVENALAAGGWLLVKGEKLEAFGRELGSVVRRRESIPLNLASRWVAAWHASEELGRL